MQNWFYYLKAGLARNIPQDRLTSEKGKGNTSSNLLILRPYLVRHWHKGVVGAGLILFISLLALPRPLINRFLIDDVITARRLDLLPIAILLIGGVKLLSMGAGIVQQFYFTGFQQGIMRDIQENLIDHALSLPKSFFDDKEVGYLISRLSSDVWGLSWFFSNNVINIITSILTFIGGVILLFYLNWRLRNCHLSIAALASLGYTLFFRTYASLSHHGMEQNARISQRFQETLATIPLIKAFASEKRREQTGNGGCD